MTVTPISDLEVKLITRELLVKAVLALEVKHAWLMENHELKAYLQEKNGELALIISQYIDALWSYHFLLKLKKGNLTEADKERYSEIVNKKNHLRNQVMDCLSVRNQSEGKSGAG
ncbi:hypothetical protein [uncultured Spirosoma sp.]|jgi:hypothetical protein|uniref:hypothetical protein n=1 Tax=uncultured Spirosoma sp. TaxID=278208 RepID=UPI00261AAA47|nr:hypothetical protein [uncultured Spirosoma sp.]MBR8840594.1 hypothetical protein [Stigonema ocellatum SAG 48.90 = DSM 106950]